MGITYITYCRKCSVSAPEIGDFGFVGAPTAALAKKNGVKTFASIYDGFAALRMVTHELAAFQAFLDEHGKHPLTMSPDTGDEEDDDGDGEDAAPAKRLRKFRFKGRKVEAFYELACAKCADAFRSSTSEPLVPFDEFTPGAAEIARFRRGAAEADEDSFSKVGGFPIDDREAVDEFLKEHKGHPLRARLDRGAKPAPVKRAAAASRPAVEPWAPPEWRPEDHEDYRTRVTEQTRSLLAGLNHRDPTRRVSACADIAGTREVAVAYLAALRDDPEPTVRAAAARGLGALPDPRAIRPLGRALLDESDSVRAAAADALRGRGVTEEEALRQARALRGPYTDAPLTQPWVEATAEAVEEVLRDPESSRFGAPDVLTAAAQEPWARDLVLVLAVDPRSHERYAIAKLLAGMDDPRAKPALLALLEDVDDSTAANAAVAAGRIKLAEAVPLLLLALDRGDAALATAAGDALAEIADPATFPPLASALEAPDPAVRKAAAVALGGLRDRRAVEPISRLLADATGSVRETAAKALGAIGGPEAAVVLASLAKGAEKESDRLAAVDGLAEMMPDPDGVAALAKILGDARGDVWKSAVYALARAQDDPQAQRALVRAARHGHPMVATVAWRALIRSGDAKFEEQLVKALGGECPEEMVRDCLFSGNERLASAAKRKLRGRRPPREAPPGVRWGERP